MRMGIRGLFSSVLLMVGLAGCSGDVHFGDGLNPTPNPNNPSAPPANINIVLSSATLLSTASDAADGVTITAIVTDAANNTIQGATVAFAATSGALQVTQAVTDSSGVATAILTTGGDSSLRQILVGAASGSVSRTAAVQVVSSTASGPPVDSLALLPASGSLTPSGSLDLQAFVANSASPTGLAGVPVTWATSAGLLTGLTLPDHTSVSDSTGNAHATLTTGGDPTLTSITVTATAGGHSQSRTYTVAGGGVGVSALNLVASGTQLAADADQVADGITIRAIATDSHGNVVSGVPVSFAIPPPSSGALIVTQGTTDANGQAVAILTTGGNSAARTINVTATVGTLTRTLSPAIQVVGTIGPVPAALNVFASSASLPATASAPANGVTISAVVTDSNGVTVPGVPVTFSAPTAAIAVTQGVTDANGIATALLTTGGNSTPRTVNVTAATGSISRTIGIAVIGAGAGPTVNAISLTASSTTLPAGATTAASAGAITLTAFVRDSNNNAVQGATVTFSSTAGQLSQIQATSDANGQATAVLSTGGDSALPPTITVSASASGHTASLPISVVNGTTNNVASINVTAASPTLSSSASTPAQGDQITATVLDSNLNPVAGVTVQFSAGAGALANINAVTDANGQATAVLTNGGSSALPSTITVTAKVGSITGSKIISVVNPIATVTLLAASPQLLSSTSQVSQGDVLTVIVTDSNGNLVQGVPVTFTASGGALQVTQGTTNAAGTATAVLTTGGVPFNRTLSVTATAGGINSNVLTINVVGTTLVISGSPVVGSGSTSTYTVTLSDSSGNGIGSTHVSLASALGNPLSPTSITTNTLGQGTFTYTGTTGGNDTLTATATGVVGTLDVSVAANRLIFTSPAASPTPQVDFGVSEPLIVNFTESGAPVVGATIDFTTTRGNLSATQATTDGSGNATVNISSSGADGAGGAVITAQVTCIPPHVCPPNDSGPTATLTIVFVATPPNAILMQASPSTVALGASSTVTATLRDSFGNLVANQQVDFTLTDVSGGTLSASNAITNSAGIASVTYIASQASSATKGVRIDGTVHNFPLVTTTGYPGTSSPAPALITVSKTALEVRIGQSKEINTDPQDHAAYQFPMDVIVQDSAGNPAPINTIVNVRVISARYFKGTYHINFVTNLYEPSYSVAGGCVSEDANNNGILDSGEDNNGNGVVDPGNVATVPATVTLTANGTGPFNLEYPKNYSNWVQVDVQATATVAGSEGSTDALVILPPSIPDVTPANGLPPGGLNSLFGVDATCADTN